MKRINAVVLACIMLVAFSYGGFAQALNASQVGKLDLSGKWSGKRMQYSADKKSFIETFQYEFDLKQEGDKITGTSTIISASGDYADMKLEGVLIGNKLHFREYEVNNAIRPTGKIWCFKSGELSFTKDGDNLKMGGATASYMEIYNYPCSGGVTDLTKVDNSSNATTLAAFTPGATVAEENKINMEAFPNPFVDYANVTYNLTSDSKVKVEVYDMSGKLISNLFDGNQNAGSYKLNFNAKGISGSGIYIVKMTVNNDVYSSQMVQMR
jgi:Secretion system C-terminal sorting domain